MRKDLKLEQEEILENDSLENDIKKLFSGYYNTEKIIELKNEYMKIKKGEK
jgi:hypothetical protein